MIFSEDDPIGRYPEDGETKNFNPAFCRRIQAFLDKDTPTIIITHDAPWVLDIFEGAGVDTSQWEVGLDSLLGYSPDNGYYQGPRKARVNPSASRTSYRDSRSRSPRRVKEESRTDYNRWERHNDERYRASSRRDARSRSPRRNVKREPQGDYGRDYDSSHRDSHARSPLRQHDGPNIKREGGEGGAWRQPTDQDERPSGSNRWDRRYWSRSPPRKGDPAEYRYPSSSYQRRRSPSPYRVPLAPVYIIDIQALHKTMRQAWSSNPSVREIAADLGLIAPEKIPEWCAGNELE